MTDDKQKDMDDNRNSDFEAEGIIIESISAKEELEQDLSTPQTKEEEAALFKAIGVEIPEKIIEEPKPTTDSLKKELDSGGIELLRTEPLGDEEL
jgi:hypothetical protein